MEAEALQEVNFQGIRCFKWHSASGAPFSSDPANPLPPKLFGLDVASQPLLLGGSVDGMDLRGTWGGLCLSHALRQCLTETLPA